MAEKNEILTLLTSQNPAGLAQLTEEFHPADILEVVQTKKTTLCCRRFRTASSLIFWTRRRMRTSMRS